MAKCEECNKELKHQKRLLVGSTGKKVCNKCYHKHTILEQLGLPTIDEIITDNSNNKTK